MADSGSESGRSSISINSSTASIPIQYHHHPHPHQQSQQQQLYQQSASQSQSEMRQGYNMSYSDGNGTAEMLQATSTSPSSSSNASSSVLQGGGLRLGQGQQARQRTAVACRYCRKRKIRCTGLSQDPQDPRCSNCTRLDQECVYAPVGTPTQGLYGRSPVTVPISVLPNTGRHPPPLTYPQRPYTGNSPRSSSLPRTDIAPISGPRLGYPHSLPTATTLPPLANGFGSLDTHLHHRHHHQQIPPITSLGPTQAPALSQPRSNHDSSMLALLNPLPPLVAQGETLQSYHS